ncbi:MULTISPECIES: helicase RepA family protein [unclassified Roseovarius]|uniref:helicase RepA family protein n=1 Tax=unclassified Roseovarius TaxID=2614913 RepID=UPI00273ED245|nr:helicase RepA family protein [Roseovarius sp. MMSF_3350]
MNKQANPFEQIANKDRKKTESEVERLSGRAGDLQAALRPLDSIKPVLSSRYLVKAWIDRGATSVVYGESNVGKTFFALDLAMHVAAGESWHGAKVPPATDPFGCVVYVAGEGGSGMHNRIEAIRKDNADLIRQAEKRHGFTLLPTMLDLCGATDAAELVKVFSTLPARIGLVVVDTLARTMGDGDENTARDMGAFVRSLDHIRNATGAHIMVIHHSGKDASKGARGSCSLRAAVDTEIQLTRSGPVIMAETRKQRDMPTGRVFAYVLRDVAIGEDEDGEPVTSAVVEPTEPIKQAPRLSAQQKIAMQALDDALAAKGKKMHSDQFPSNRRCVPLSVWRELCDRHGLSDGQSDSAQRRAFHAVKKALHTKEVVRIFDDHVWRCDE